MHLPPALSLTGVFRLILYWKRILISGSSCIGQFSPRSPPVRLCYDFGCAANRTLTERWLSGRKQRFAKPSQGETSVGGSNPPLSAISFKGLQASQSKENPLPAVLVCKTALSPLFI